MNYWRERERLTNKQDKSARQYAAKDWDNKSAWCDVVTCEITKHWNAESLKYVIHVEQWCQHLNQVTHNIVPFYSACIPTPAIHAMHTVQCLARSQATNAKTHSRIHACVIYCVVTENTYLLVACVTLYYVFYDVIKVS